MINKKLGTLGAAGVLVAALVVGPVTAYAQSTANSQLTQEINAGVLSTSIRNETGTVVASPSFAMTAISASTSEQTATGTFGSNTQRITVDNPGAANGGWSLSLNATTPGTSTWTSGANSYPYNGASSAAGQLTVNPAAGTLTAVTGGSTGVTLGSSATFSGTSSVSLATASAASADIWNGYITGIGLNQTIPAGQAVGNYTLDVTQTVVAN